MNDGIYLDSFIKGDFSEVEEIEIISSNKANIITEAIKVALIILAHSKNPISITLSSLYKSDLSKIEESLSEKLLNLNFRALKSEMNHFNE